MVLEIDSVSKAFEGQQILSGIYMKFETGKITGIFGRNGSGKSTLFNIMMGIEKATSSSMRIDGIYKPKIYKEGLLKYMGQNCVLPKSARLKTILPLLDHDLNQTMVDFEKFRIEVNKKTSEFSTGQQRLIELIIYLNSESPFLILDEPFNNIMPMHLEWVMAKIMAKKGGIIIADHQYRLMLDICEDAYLIKDTFSKYLGTNIKEGLIDLGYIRV